MRLSTPLLVACEEGLQFGFPEVNGQAQVSQLSFLSPCPPFSLGRRCFATPRLIYSIFFFFFFCIDLVEVIVPASVLILLWILKEMFSCQRDDRRPHP